MEQNTAHHGLLEIISTEHLVFNFNSAPPGLLNGKSGAALFLFYFGKYSKDQQYFSKGAEIIRQTLSEINSGFNYHTYCDGIAGFAWLLDHLALHKFVARDDVMLLKQLDPYLSSRMLDEANAGWFDFLHGGIGIANYYVNSSSSSAEKNLNTVIDYLKRHVVVEDECLYWTRRIPTEDEIGIDFGLAHGMTGTLLFLTKYIERYRHNPVARELAYGCARYLIKQQKEDTSGQLEFPSRFVNGKYEFGRTLGWCYGGISTAYALLRVSYVLDDLALRKVAHDLMMRETIRSTERHDITDGEICHGASGLSQILLRSYWLTGTIEYSEYSKYWLDRIVSLRNSSTLSGVNADCGVLNGDSGIGLALLSQLSAENTWDSCLLLS